MRIYEVVTAACGDTKGREGGRAYTGTTDRSPGLEDGYLEVTTEEEYDTTEDQRRVFSTTHHFPPSTR